ncbi:MAG: SlyX family protein [Gammaproteobacteria bacterium]|nr:SlyX family protein [Gammaproteobacteria bacterium]MBU0770941.1 SlyX family protein [Gammaproteobacteria bacterium]MBU0856778.1 SlyX family protein [Gammaproteobacteria bacterium]MBU1845541.1 SlyX family protein [Gammaproteobacteria bacterium]
MSERLNDLEARITLMDDMLDALNRTVYAQQQQIASLQQQLRHVYQQMQSLTPPEAGDGGQELPPHY